MQNKPIDSYGINNGMFKACLLLLLFTQPGFAQQSSTRQLPANATSVTTPATKDDDSTSADLSKSSPKKTNNTKVKRSPSTQFTPTEKVRADDAVAFPVDI